MGIEILGQFGDVDNPKALNRGLAPPLERPEDPKMTDDTPIACSLGAGELRQRLAAIAEVGADSLISRDVKDDRHRLRFRAGAATRRRLEEIVAAEAECCSFLDLSLTDAGNELVLSIAAPRDAQAFADDLAAAFAVASRSS